MQRVTKTSSRLRALVAKVALADTSWMKDPRRVAHWPPASAAERLALVPLPSNKAFGDMLFFAVLDPTEKPGTRSQVVVVIAGEARAICTMHDFQQLIIEKRMRPAFAETALDIAKQYVFVLGFKYPQYADKVKILNSFQDIPLRVNERVSAHLQSLIRPPEVQKHGGNFLVHVFAWNEVGGELRGFDFRCSKEGRFEAKVNVLRESLGKAWLPK